MESKVDQVERPAPDLSGLQELLERAASGDESVLPGIRAILDLLPQSVSFFGGDLAQKAEQSLLNSTAGKNLAQREALLRKMEQLRTELSGANPDPLERLLVDRVALCWLQSVHADCQYAYATVAAPTRVEFLQRHRGHAHRQFLSATKCLTAVKRLALPIKADVAGTATGSAETTTRGPTDRSNE